MKPDPLRLPDPLELKSQIRRALDGAAADLRDPETCRAIEVMLRETFERLREAP